MALNLEELKFVVNTEDLDTAATKIKTLGDALNKINKPVKESAVNAEKLAQAQAKTAEATAKAELAAAKAALAAEKLGKSQDSATGSSKNQVSVLEKQIMVLEYMAQGHSRGQASMMATAKVAGAVSSEIDELSKTLRTQRTLMGTDPFDKSIGALESWTNKVKVAEEVEQLYNRSLGLTKTQMQELAIEKQRLIALAAMEGKSMQQVEAEYQKIIGIASTLAQKQNTITSTIKQQDKASSDAAKATAYLADADARLAAALDVSNAKLDKAGSDALVKYEKALRQTGMSSDEAAVKLAKAKTQFDAIADKKQADKLQYLARAISVQMGDVGISLASGMNPLLVMIQQGDQIRGAIQQAGASGKQLEQAMAGAAAQIATSFLQTGQAIGGFFVNAIKSAGAAVLGFPITLLKTAFSTIIFGGASAAESFKQLTIAAIAFSKVGIVLIIAALATLATAMYESLKLERELSVNLATTGAGMRMNRAEAIAYADSLSSAGKSSSQYAVVLNEMAKEGYNAGANFKLVADSAIAMEKYAGTPIANTVKAFEELSTKPVEGIEKLAKEMRGVSPEVVKLVNELARQGKVADAASVAIKEMARINAAAVKQIAADAGYLERIWLDVIDNIAKGWARVKGFVLGWGTEDTLNAQLMQKQKQLAGFKEGDTRPLIAAEKTKIENEIRGLQEQIELQTKAKSLREANDVKAKAETEWQGLLNKHLAKESEIKRDLAEIERVGLKAGKDAVEIQRLKNEYLAKQPKTAVTVQASKDLSIIQKDYGEQLKLAEGFARDERSILKARFDAGLIERADFIAQDTDLLNRSEQKQLEVINSFSAKYKTAYEAQATLLAQAFGKAKDPENKKQLQEQLVNLTKDFEEFNATVEDTKSKIDSAFSAREQVALLEFEKAAFASTKTFKEYAKAQEDIVENKRIDLELQDRLTNAYGAEAASIKAVADETKRQTAEVSKFTKAQEEAYKQYLIVLNNPNASGTERGAAYSAYITAMTNANKAIDIARTSIVQAGIDAEMLYYMQEYNKLKSSIADVITTALFEGGKAGGKKLRDVLEAELRKPITVFVNAVVNSLMGNSTGASGGNLMGNLASSFISKAAGSISIGGGSLAAAGEAFGTGFMTTLQGGSVAEAAGAYSAAGMQGVSTGLSAGAQLATAVPYVAAAVVALNALGAFRTTKQVGGGISGTLGAGDINSYATMRKSGTLFRGPSYWRENRGEFAGSDALQASFAQLKDTTAQMAEVVGVSSDAVKSYTKDIEISFDGLTDAQIQEKITTTFKDVGNELAALVLGAGATAEQLSSLYNNIMQQRYDLETQLLELQGNTIALRERERTKIYETNQALYDQIKALEDAKPALEEKTKLEQQLAILQGKTTQAAVDRAALLNDENRGIYDQIQALQEKKAADEEAVRAMEKLTSVTTTIVDEINRLRGTDTNQAGLEAQFAILTAQARAGDITALGKLPEVTKGLEQIAGATAVNATDIVMARARLAQSLQDTLGYTGANGFLSASPTATSISAVSTTGTGVTATVSATSSNQELLSALVTEVQGLRAEVRADVSHNAKTAKILERANQDGETLSVSATIDGGVV